ncbi:histidinol-phosphate transaminase [Kibdelosporangium aridum]|uniref:Histidinol-phosphate aminotransferase n=2 Tax=Kibdelosporangium aridum TaxID=2030 RepID=A0A428Z0U3_KIBAR|nr:histidinol-phosphate transaminase [Kibdelosporangium aridum]
MTSPTIPTTTLRTRPDLAGLASFRAGPTLERAIKLDSNELPYGPLASVRDVLSGAVGDVNRYPDNTGAELAARLAERYGVSPDNITLGPGSVNLCLQLAQVTCAGGDEIVIPWRSFEAYPSVAKTVGATVRTVALTADHRPDLPAMAAAISDRTRLVFVCTPNNPTGTVLGRAELEQFFDTVPDDVIVVLDEAYCEFTGDIDTLDGVEFVKQRLAEPRHNIVAMRTFSKAYGLAGLRVGYCVSAEPVSDLLKRVALPYSVNALAQRAAVASLAATGELAVRCKRISAERDRVRAALLAAGYEVPVSGANFLWLPLDAATERFKQHCLASRILVRAFPGNGVRVTIGEPDENDAFVVAARTFQCG